MPKIEYIDPVLDAAGKVIQVCWSDYPSVQTPEWSPENSRWVLGGYNATRIASGLAIDRGDMDFFLSDPDSTQPKNLDVARQTIGEYFHQKLCSYYSVKPQKISKVTGRGRYFNFTVGKCDYTIGSRRIYSNFQVSIDLKTKEIVFDTKHHPDHEKDFERYKNNHEILTYNFEALIAEALDYKNKNGTKVLAWVMKSYVKPLEQGKRFSNETATSIIQFKKNHLELYYATISFCQHHYKQSFQSLEKIYESAIEVTVKHKELLKQNVLQDELVALKKQLAEKDAEIDRLKIEGIKEIPVLIKDPQSDEHEKIIAENKDRIEALENDLQSEKKKNINLQGEVGSLNGLLLDVKEKLIRSESDAKSYRRMVEDRERKIETLEKSISVDANAQLKRESLWKTIRSLENDISAKKLNQHVLEKENQELKKNVDALEARIAEITLTSEKLDAKNEKLKDDLKELREKFNESSESLTKILGERESNILIAMQMKYRLIDPHIDKSVIAAEYRKIKSEGGNECLDLSIAGATIEQNRLAIVSCYMEALNFEPRSNDNTVFPSNWVNMQELFAGLDYEIWKNSKSELSPDERMAEIRKTIYAIFQFCKTPYFHHNNPMAASHKGLGYLSTTSIALEDTSPALDEFKAGCKQAQLLFDDLRKYLFLNIGLFNDYFKSRKDKKSVLSPQLIDVLKTFYMRSWPALDENVQKSVMSNSIYALCRACDVDDDEYVALIAAYTDIKKLERNQLANAIFKNAFKKFFSCTMDEIGKTGKHLKMLPEKVLRSFIKVYAIAITQKFPDADVTFIVGSYYMSLDLHFGLRKNMTKWLNHPLVTCLSIIFRNTGAFQYLPTEDIRLTIIRAQEQLNDDPIIARARMPNSTGKGEQVLPILIDCFLRSVDHDTRVAPAYEKMLKIIESPESNASATAVPILSLRTAVTCNHSDLPLSEQMAKAKVFLQAVDVMVPVNVETQLVQIGQHIAAFSDDTIIAVAKLIQKGAQEQSFNTWSMALDGYVYLGKANFSFWRKFFLEADILKYLGFDIDPANITLLLKQVTWLGIIYKAFEEHDLSLTNLYAHIDYPELQHPQDFSVILDVLKRLPTVPTRNEIQTILTYALFEGTELKKETGIERMEKLAQQFHAELSPGLKLTA